MRKIVLTGSLAATLCIATLALAGTPSRQPVNGQTQYSDIWEAQQQHWQKTADLRQQVTLDQYQLAAMMVDPKTTEDQLLKKQRQLQAARNKLEREQLSFLFEMKRKYPEVFGSYGTTGSYGMGPGMMGYYGMGPGMMGYYGMGPGMMGSYGMGPGMMGCYGTGSGRRGGYYHMGPGGGGGYPMGPGMMNGRGQ